MKFENVERLWKFHFIVWSFSQALYLTHLRLCERICGIIAHERAARSSFFGGGCEAVYYANDSFGIFEVQNGCGCPQPSSTHWRDSRCGQFFASWTVEVHNMLAIFSFQRSRTRILYWSCSFYGRCHWRLLTYVEDVQCLSSDSEEVRSFSTLLCSVW